jgi:hypothetical protein
MNNNNNNNNSSESRTAAITSYILGIGVFIAMSMNSKKKLLYFHIRQGLTLLTFISLGLIISNFDSLMISAPMWIFVCFMVLWHY